MDVIKKSWLVVLKYQFWILSGLVLIATSAVFFLTSSSLGALISSRTSALKSTYDKVNTISGSVPSHPNPFSHVEMDKSLVLLEKDIKEAWDIQYRGQIPLMEWPRKAFKEDSTHKIFESLRPVEKFIEFPIPATLPPPYNKITLNDRDVYKKYIGPEFASVSSIIRTEWKARLGGGAAESASNATPLPDVVRWSAESQQTMLGQIVPWFDKGTAPSILEIYYTQEDMWLLKGIMDIIRRANGDARENFQTVVREIEWIRMGRFASRNAGVLAKKETVNAGGGSGMSSGMLGKDGGGMMEDMAGSGSSGGNMDGDSSGSSGGSGGFGDATVAADPADNRYISFATESLFQPRKGAELRESIKNAPTASNAVDAVAKRVAIRMRLKVDPANLSRLITECGNAGNKGLLLEVYQVRVGTDAAPATGGGGGGGGYSGGMGGPKGAVGMGGMSGGGGSSSMMSSGGGPDGEGGSSFGAAAVSEDSSSEIAIEIFGLIYLYNPENIVTITNELTADKSESVPANAGATPVAADPKPETPASDPAPSSDPATSSEPAAPVEPVVEPNTVQPDTVQPNSGQPTEPATPEPAGSDKPSDN